MKMEDGKWKMGNRKHKPEIVNSHNLEMQHFFLFSWDFTIFLKH